MSWRPTAGCERGGSSPPARGAAHPGNSRRGRCRPGERPARSRGRPAAEPGSPCCPSLPTRGCERGSGWAGPRASRSGGRGARRERRAALFPLLETGNRLLPRPAAGDRGGGSGSSFTSFFPTLSQPAAAAAAVGKSRFRPDPHRGKLAVTSCRPKHSLKSGPLGEDFRLQGEPCQASWDL